MEVEQNKKKKLPSLCNCVIVVSSCLLFSARGKDRPTVHPSSIPLFLNHIVKGFECAAGLGGDIVA